MNFSFDWGAVVVCGVGAAVSVIVMKNDIKWLRDTFEASITRLEDSLNTAHSRIDGILTRQLGSRTSDRDAA